MKRNPKYFTAHIPMAEKLMRRWGGDPGDDQRFVSRVADAIGGIEGDVMYARLAAKLAIYEEQDDFFNVSGFDYERIQRGWKRIEEIAPPGRFGLLGQFFFADYKNDTTRAKALFDRIEKEHYLYTPGILPDRRVYDQMLAKYEKLDASR